MTFNQHTRVEESGQCSVEEKVIFIRKRTKEESVIVFEVVEIRFCENKVDSRPSVVPISPTVVDCD